MSTVGQFITDAVSEPVVDWLLIDPTSSAHRLLLTTSKVFRNKMTSLISAENINGQSAAHGRPDIPGSL